MPGADLASLVVALPRALAAPNHTVLTCHAPMYCVDTSCSCEPAAPTASLVVGSATNEVRTVVGAVASGILVSTAIAIKSPVIAAATARNPPSCKKRSDGGEFVGEKG